MIKYTDEHLLIGQIGTFFTLLAFAAAMVAFFSYYKTTRHADTLDEKSWKSLSRAAFVINAVSILAVFVTLYLIIYNHYFEYKYAHQHSKRSLDVQYLLSCFWEGQEGSFMLWGFWNAVIGLVLLKFSKKWEAPVMTVISLLQVFLASFLIGIYFFDLRIGSNPFVLMRNEFPDAPIFQDPDYLTKYLTDGNGLNVLLQNYWMVIHPPILFLGFSSAVVPYAYALAGLWKKDHKGWIRPAMPWALFCAGILGLGIMMGAAWAYESLTFGGYWAWDPVENASLVPWLLLVAGIHTLLIFQSTGHSLKASYMFIVASYLLVLYSTFLTRTGVLGDTSVHSFTGEGSTLYWHLIIMMLAFLSAPLIFYFKDRKNVPVEVKEENLDSREFWMFVGSLLLFIAGLYIIILTSLPFFNKLFGTKWAIGEDVEFVYNRIMVLVAIILGLLTAMTQYLKYKNTTRKFIWSKLWIPTALAFALSISISYFGNIDYNKYGSGYLAAIHLALFSSIYAVVANFHYLAAVIKWKMKAAGSSIAHVGFGMMLVGILISSSKKELISENRTGIAVAGLKDAKGKDEDPRENVTLIYNVPTPMGKYTVTYLGDSAVEKDDRVYFKIKFLKTDTADNSIVEEFDVRPNAFLMKSGEGTNLSSNPGARHYLSNDVFVYITSWLNPDNIKDTAAFNYQKVTVGDTVFYSNGFVVVDRLLAANKNDNKDLPVVDSAWLSELSVYAKDGRKFSSTPAFFVKDGGSSVKTDTIMEQSLIFALERRGQEVRLGLKESNAVMRYITLKAYRFPWINLLWLGTIIMVVGFLLSMWNRMKSKLYVV
ncbi:MAG: cytochrome c biosis protein CcsA [Bacteroidota bacterium]|jgi:cytochrome c-type biogenesis protein CcmF